MPGITGGDPRTDQRIPVLTRADRGTWDPREITYAPWLYIPDAGCRTKLEP